MRYPAPEKLEIIRIVEKSHSPVKQTLEKRGIPRATFYRWYDLNRLGGIAVLEDHRPLPGNLLKMKNQMRQILHSVRPHEVHIYLTMDTEKCHAGVLVFYSLCEYGMTRLGFPQ